MESADTNLPRILVVVPTLGDRTQTLQAALKSVRDQDEVLVRLAVVAPSGASEARLLAEQYGACVVDDPGRGLSGAVNRAITDQGEGMDYFAWLGDDDLLLPGGLGVLVQLLQRFPMASAAYGACVYLDEVGRELWVSRAGRLADAILPWGPDLVPQPASLVRMTLLARAGIYDESLKFAMDLDMFLRLRKLGPLVSVRRSVAAFTWHASSLTVANRSLSLAESKMVKRRYLSRGARRVSFLWEYPVDIATRLAVARLNRKIRKGPIEW